MEYAQLYDIARDKLMQAEDSEQRGNLFAILGYKLIEHNALLYAVTVLIWLYQKTVLQFLIRKSGLLRAVKLDKAESLMPKVDISKLAGRYRTNKQHRGNVALFTGCISDYFDRKTLLASIKSLNAIGFDVLVPKKQTCCGAIHQHQGRAAIADQMAALNSGIFNSLDVEAIIYTASGCGLILNEYGQRDAGIGLKGFGKRLFDITEFLNLHWPENTGLNDLHAIPIQVAVHEPCSQRNVTPVSGNRHQHAYALLEKIPGITVIPLPENQFCCGAGGVHMLTHPEVAEPLRNAKLAHFEQTQAEWLVSTNIGCALHLNTGLTRNKVVHPVVLLADLLP
jgi:glycolate oxidase iron-sulfur subunit